jgi:hypothetical protein
MDKTAISALFFPRRGHFLFWVWLGLGTLASSCPAQNSIRIYSPTNGTVFLQPANVPLSILLQASVVAPYTSRVEFYNGTNFIGSSPVPENRFLWTNVSFGDHTLVAVLQLSGGEAIYSSNITVRVAYGGNAIVCPGSPWHYRDGGVDLGSGWRGTNVDVSAWPQGLAKLGFGDDDVVTPVHWQNPTNGEVYPTYYFRHAFNVPDPAVHSNLAVRLRRDDGAIVYLNGEELFRDNLPEGDVDYLTYASRPVYDESEFIQRWINPARLRPGANFLAVEVHNYGPHNEDVGYDLALVADIPVPAPSLGVQRKPAEVVVAWPADYAGYGLESATTIRPNGMAWEQIPNQVSTTSGMLVHTNRANETLKFFRLRLP